MIRIDDLIAKVSAFQPGEEVANLLRKAYIYSATLHRDKFFPGGAPYLQHALEVSYILSEIRTDPVCAVAGLLHDVLEESLADTGQLRETVGDEVADLVEELSKLSRATYRGSEESRAEHMRQMILASTRDLRVILILLADRLQLMRSLDQLDPADRSAVALETLHIYSPIAHRLGINYFLGEMEDLAFRELEPEAAGELHRRVVSRVAERRERIEAINRKIQQMLADNGLQGEVIGRTKHLYSIHRKMKRNQVELEQVYDLLATRIILDAPADCYKALGLLHAAYTPLPERFKDYIALPKENGYQSLHTTVFGAGGEIVEIQIRTHGMHRQAELGIAAHFVYKQGSQADRRELADLSWFRGLLEHLEAGQNPQEMMDLFHRELVPDEIFVFTPMGEVIKLPADATAIDFAYAIHSDVGDHCSGAKADGRMVPIRSALANGSVVEIVTSGRSAPRKDWLKYAVTSKALTRIRAHIRNREKTAAARQGKEACSREAKRIGKRLAVVLATEGVREWMRRHNLRTPDELFAAQGSGSVRFRDALEPLCPEKPAAPAARRKGAAARPGLPPEKRVRIAGMDNLMLRFARCCSPKYGAPLKGIITQGQGVSIHRRDCHNLSRVKNSSERLLDVEWIREKSKAGPVTLVVSAGASAESLVRATGLLEEEGMPVRSGKIVNRAGAYVQRLTLDLDDSQKVERILQRLNAIEGIRAERELESA